MDVNQVIEKIKAEKDPFSKAKLINFLVKEKGIRIKDLAQTLDIKPSYVCHFIRLNRLPEIIVDGYYSKIITLSHLFLLSRLKSKEKMVEAYEKILAKNLTVLEVEELVREILYQVDSQGEKIKKEELAQLIKTVQNTNTKIQVIQTRIKSKLSIEIKGNLKETSKTLREYLAKLMK